MVVSDAVAVDAVVAATSVPLAGSPSAADTIMFSKKKKRVFVPKLQAGRGSCESMGVYRHERGGSNSNYCGADHSFGALVLAEGHGTPSAWEMTSSCITDA